MLVASKAYNVARAAAVPRLLPDGLTLVTANARNSMAGLVGVAISAPIAAGAAMVGPEWSLRYAFVVFVVATVLAIRLPSRVDSSQGEESIGFLSGETQRRGRRRWTAGQGPDPGVDGLRPARQLRAAVALGLPHAVHGVPAREHPIGGYSPQFLLAVVIGGAGAGNIAGIAIGTFARRLHPRITVVLALLADVAAVTLAALFYGLVSLVVLGFTVGLAQCLAKLSLDSTIQRDVPERVQTSAFARSDTTLQLAWVIGGFVGIAMPLQPRLGLTIAAVVLLAWSVFVLAKPGRRTPVPVAEREQRPATP